LSDQMVIMWWWIPRSIEDAEQQENASLRVPRRAIGLRTMTK